MTARQILVVDPDESGGEALAAKLRRANSSWQVCTARGRTGVEQLLRTQRMDAIIADVTISAGEPEAILKAAAELSPAAYRLALSGNYDHASTLRAMGYAHQNLWKPCPDAEIHAALARAFALRDTLENDRLRLLIAQINTLPSLPRLYLDFLDEVRKTSPSSERLAAIIRQDISLCSKMLQLVNSAFFGLPHKINNPEEALLYLGLENVKALVLSIQVFSLFDRVRVRQFSLETLWEHSWQVGGLARKIALQEKRSTEEVETAFTAGLLHDIGKLVLLSGVPRAWEEALNAAGQDRQPLWQAERDHLGATHSEVGAALLAMWGLADPIVEAVAFHNEPATSGTSAFCALTAVHAANALLNGAKTPSDYLQSAGAGDRFEQWRKLLN